MSTTTTTTTTTLDVSEHKKLLEMLHSREDAALAARVLETVYTQYTTTASKTSPQYLIDT